MTASAAEAYVTGILAAANRDGFVTADGDDNAVTMAQTVSLYRRLPKLI